jgi:hypothetical protein
MIGDPGLQAKPFDACATRLRHQGIQNLASDSSTSRPLFNPHSLNLSPTVVENNSASCKGFPLRVPGHEETHLGPSKRIQRKMMLTFGRIEAGRERLPMMQKFNDIGLSGVFLSDHQSGGSEPRVRH